MLCSATPVAASFIQVRSRTVCCLCAAVKALLITLQTQYDIFQPMTIPTCGTSKAMRRPSRAYLSTQAKITFSPAAKTTLSAFGMRQLRTPVGSSISTAPISQHGTHRGTFSQSHLRQHKPSSSMTSVILNESHFPPLIFYLTPTICQKLSAKAGTS